MLKRVLLRFRDLFLPAERVKEIRERECWKKVYDRSGGTLNNEYYEYFYTSAFELDREFYRGKSVLDIGCGPRGSLEWGTMMSRRVGLDPLVDAYEEFGINQHAMDYCQGYCEAMPFADASYDVVTSMNSLDHVSNLKQSISEICRVMKPGGSLLLISDIHEHPTKLEPQAFGWDIVDQFPSLRPVFVKKLEKSEPASIYESVQMNQEFDFDNPKSRYGILLARFQKHNDHD